MQDDTTQRSPERLDETRHERGERSFFDWLVGEKSKEETEEERLRKKLDKELKEAAKKRAEQFEEERRVEEQREVAETRKLKKRWRAKLVEKSRQRLEKAEADDSPADGYAIAQLMVAERIVALHDMLSDESLDLRRSEIKALKIHIDFMGLLSEKLDTPELEVPAEIEQLYQTIAESVAETHDAPDSPPTPAPEQRATPNTPPPPESEHEAAYRSFATSVVRSIREALQPPPAPATTSVPSPTSSEPNEQLPYSSTLQPETIPQPARSTPEQALTAPETTSLLSIIRETALPTETLMQEIHHTETVRRLAEVVERAETVAHTTERPQSLTTETPETPRARPAGDIETWSESELVDTARSVSLGSGRYLAEAYRRGEIDRSGLIKVLKSYMKGRDYRTEFTQQHKAYRRRTLERLAQPAATGASLREPVDSESLIKTSEQEPVVPVIQPIVSYPPQSKSKPARSPFSLQTMSPAKRQASVYLLLASVLLIIFLAVFVVSLF